MLLQSRRWLFGLMGGYCSTTFYYLSLCHGSGTMSPVLFPTPHRSYNVVSGHGAVMSHIQHYAKTYAIILAFVTIAGGWTALTGSGLAYVTFGQEGLARMNHGVAYLQSAIRNSSF